MFTPDHLVEQQINLTALPGWIYRTGHNPVWAMPGINTVGWQRMKPGDLSVKNADKTGKVEVWFRLKGYAR